MRVPGGIIRTLKSPVVYCKSSPWRYAYDNRIAAHGQSLSTTSQGLDAPITEAESDATRMGDTDDPLLA